jgi:putative spermidine/putrescine transport system permease protein
MRRLSTWGPILVARSVVGLILAVILLPSVVVMIAAFNDRAFLTFPPQVWSWRWFKHAFTYEDFQDGLWHGAIVTSVASSLGLCIGTAFVYAIRRRAFRAAPLIETILSSPLIIPHFTIGLGLLILVAQMGFARGYGLVIFTHVLLVLPFVVRSVHISLQNIDPRLERAATSLGARPWRAALTITLPLLAPGLASGWLFAAILSFNEFTASLFVTTQATQTLPVAMYNYVREFADPTLAAMSVVYIVVTALLLVVANTFLGLGRVLNVEHGA